MARQLCGIIVVLVFASAAIATPTIDAGKIIVVMNSAGEQEGVYVTGGDAVQGMEFNITTGGGSTGPIITAVDVLTGTIFNSNNGGGFAGYVNSYDAYKGVVTASGTVSASGLIATVTFDATGFTTWGTYAFTLTNGEGDTTFTDLVPATLISGQIIVTIAGDANGDGHVTLADLTILATNFGGLGSGSSGDFNNSGDITLADLTILATKFGDSAPGAPIPEPVSLGLLAIGGVALLRRKR